MASNFDSEDSPTRRFNVEKYSEEAAGGQLRAPIAPYIDAPDSLANQRQMVVSFRHESSGKEVYFKAFITALNETYNSEWTREKVFGRVDPIQLFRSTERQITLALKVPAASMSEAYENLGRIQLLTQFLYPTYMEDGSAAQLIAQAPLVRLKVMNLIKTNKADETASGIEGRSSFKNYKSDLTATNGLLGSIGNLHVNHNLESNEGIVIEKGVNTILPTFIDINLSFSPIHEHPIGWNEKGEALSATFPYGVDLHTEEHNIDPTDAYNRDYALDFNFEGMTHEEKLAHIIAQGADRETMDKLMKEEFGDRDVAQQALDNSAARYSGWFRDSRFDKDLQAVKDGTASDYQRSSVAGETNRRHSRKGSYSKSVKYIYDLEY
jgi:hypothetical protein